MNSLLIRINEFRTYLIETNIAQIKKNKSKLIKIKSKDSNEMHIIQKYNYYVRLIKKIKRYIDTNDCNEIILKMIEDKDNNNNIICIATSIEKHKIDIGLHIQITLLTGNECQTELDCTYYNTILGGKLYLNDFKSIRPQKGYGSIILKNIENIVYLINNALTKMQYEEINILEGVMIANTKIISEEELRKLYLKHDFEIDNKNNIKRLVYKYSLEKV